MSRVGISARRLLGTSIGQAAATVWSALLGLITTPLLIHHLGTASYGALALITIVSGYLRNLEFGFGHATVRFLARALAGEDCDEEQAVISNSLLIFVPAAVLAGSLSFFGASFIVREFAHGPHSLHDSFVTAVQLGSAVIALSLLGAWLGSALQAFGQFRFLISTSASFGTVLSVSAVAIAVSGGGLVGIVAAQLVVNTLLCVVQLVALRRQTSARLIPRYSGRTFKAMATFSALTFIGGLGVQTVLQAPPAVLAAYTTTATVAAFAVPSTIFQQLTGLVGASSLGFLPFTSAASVNPDRAHVRDLYTANLRMTIFTLAPIVCVLAAFAKPLLTFWIGHSFALAATPPLRVIGAATLMLGLSAAPNDVARGFGRAGLMAAFAISAAIATLGISFIAIPRYGAGGAAFALSAGLAAAAIPFLFLVGRMLLEIRPFELLRALLGPVLGLVCLLALDFGAALLSEAFLVAIVSSVLGTAVYAGVVYKYLLTPRERDVLSALRPRRNHRDGDQQDVVS